MAKPEQVLNIEPQNELRFRGPFSSPVTSYMKLINPSDKKVLFKIKTTAPKKYCVRPNSGVLDPSNSIEIAISLQPFQFDPAEKNKHKFMVQTLFAPDGDVNIEQLWKEIGPDQLMDSKLKCVFEMPVEQNESNQEGEPANKASPKAVVAPIPNNAIDPELQKAAEEVQQLREEESSLRQENLRLKEEILQLKMQAGTRGGVTQPNRYSPPAQQQQQIPLMYMAVAIILGFLGIILGKFIL